MSASRYMPPLPDSLEFEVFCCPDLGLVSAKACSVCRVLRKGKCKVTIKKKSMET